MTPDELRVSKGRGPVIPAKAGIHRATRQVPAFAGMTGQAGMAARRNEGLVWNCRATDLGAGMLPAPMMFHGESRRLEDYFRFISAGSVFLK